MPANDGRHVPSHHHARTRTISAAAAAAAIITLALAACTATTVGSTSTSSPAPPAASSGGPAATLTGSGSTFDAPFFDAAFARYHQENPAVAIGYSAVGSSAGIAAFTTKQADFGASDVPMTAAQQAAAHGGASVQVPVDLGAEAIAYNLTGLPQLHLTGPVIARIFLGQITSWNDPAITALNPHVACPARRSSSCTVPTAAAPPTSSATTFPASTPPGRPRSGQARPCTGRPRRSGWKATPASPTPSPTSRSPSATSNAPTCKGRSCLTPPSVTRPGTTPPHHRLHRRRRRPKTRHHADRLLHRQRARANSYPISGYSWALIYTRQASQATGQALVNLLDWLTHSGQAYAATTGYVPLPTPIQQLARTMLQQVTGPDGARLLG